MKMFFSRHPDKNKSPGAEDMFIKITKSYEVRKVLSSLVSFGLRMEAFVSQ